MPDVVADLRASGDRIHGALVDVHSSVGAIRKKNRTHATNVAKLAGRRLVRVPMPARHSALITSSETKFEQIAAHALLVIRTRVTAALGHHTQKVFAKRSPDGETMGEAAVREFLAAIDADLLEWGPEARSELRSLYQIIAEERATTSLESLTAHLGDADMAAMVTQSNQAAITWAHERVGNLITGVSGTTRDAINELSATAIEAGWSNQQLADELQSAWEFSPERALMIARTEPTFAESAGSIIGYTASGVVEGKGWSAEDPCDECAANESDGIIPLDDQFSSGDDSPPAHPNCKCAVYAAVLVDE